MDGDGQDVAAALQELRLNKDPQEHRAARIAIRVAPGAPASIPVPCRHYLNGFCVNGDQCRFLHPPRTSASGHARPESRPTPTRSTAANSTPPPAFSLSLSPTSSHPFTPPSVRVPPRNNEPLTNFAPPRIEDFTHPTSTSSATNLSSTFDPPNSLPALSGFSTAFASVLADSDDEDEADALLRAASTRHSSVHSSSAYTASIGAAHACTYAAVAAPPEREESSRSRSNTAWSNVSWAVNAQPQCTYASSPHSTSGSPSQYNAFTSVPAATSHPSIHMPVCRYHIRNQCHYGSDYCRYPHGLECHRCGLNVIHPYNEDTAIEHELECAEEYMRKERMRKSENVECGICYERPVAIKRKFGLLQNCDHAFCLPCIREWRGQDSANHFGREAVRACPVCRVESYLVIPSDTYESDASVREQLLNQYRAKLKTIPCKHFNYGQGECPFSGSCLYAHVDAAGNPIETPEKPPLLLSDSGVRVKTTTLSLADYIRPRR